MNRIPVAINVHTKVPNSSSVYYSATDRGAEYCDDRVCLSVWLFPGISPELHV